MGTATAAAAQAAAEAAAAAEAVAAGAAPAAEEWQVLVQLRGVWCIHYTLPTTHYYTLPTTHYLLHTTYYTLPTTHCARTRNGRLLGADSSSLIVLQRKEVLCVHVLCAGAQRDPGACKCTL
jgi:hypothetical protein